MATTAALRHEWSPGFPLCHAGDRGFGAGGGGQGGANDADVALVVPHQANVRIIETAAKRLKVPEESFYLSVDRAGNTSAASIPIALCGAVEARAVETG